ncbi:hypothetical protein [Tenacibaculum ovolyticum]|uniref:hypothetical protein n=1 Tax=Tenacibaculum ovolyticum TaxID=104270 RepID=UPI000405F45E|nr:hypothetical protein [Tenacibaculum ovolyticum]
MKKVILMVAMVFATSGLVNANSSVEKMSVIEDGGASECAQYARGVILKASEEYNIDISRESSHFRVMMDAYHAIYLDCYNN